MGGRSQPIPTWQSREIACQHGHRRHYRLDRLLARHRKPGSRLVGPRVEPTAPWLNRPYPMRSTPRHPPRGCFQKSAEQALNFEVFATGGVELAVATARNYRTLRALGHTVRKTVDCLIATLCLDGHTLLHRDRDFDPFEKHLGLRVVHP
jgi:hypothetical protein